MATIFWNRMARCESSRLPDEAPALIDEFPVLSAIAACIDGESRFEGLGELRFKESNRLEALAAGLTALGVGAWVDDDTLFVRGRARVSSPVRCDLQLPSFDDHRIVLALCVAAWGLGCRPLFDDVNALGDSYPTFFDDLRRLRRAYR